MHLQRRKMTAIKVLLQFCCCLLMIVFVVSAAVTQYQPQQPLQPPDIMGNDPRYKNMSLDECWKIIECCAISPGCSGEFINSKNTAASTPLLPLHPISGPPGGIKDNSKINVDEQPKQPQQTKPKPIPMQKPKAEPVPGITPIQIMIIVGILMFIVSVYVCTMKCKRENRLKRMRSLMRRERAALTKNVIDFESGSTVYTDILPVPESEGHISRLCTGRHRGQVIIENGSFIVI